LTGWEPTIAVSDTIEDLLNYWRKNGSSKNTD
jgi:nucleoside-diphosphate-sugar epimerase